MATEISEAYKVSVAQLSIFTSVAFYPCAVAQPIAGLLSDVMEAQLLIGTCSLICASGALICGLSNSLIVGCVGRLLVGMGSGFIYGPFCRICANWWPLHLFPRIVGFYMAIGNSGTLIGQTPLAMLVRVMGWRWGFYLGAMIEALAGIIVLFTVRADPRDCGYNAVNRNVEEKGFGVPVDGKITMKHRCTLLTANMKHVLSNRNFWMAAVWYALVQGFQYSIVTMWGTPFLKDVYGWDSVKAGNAMLAMVLAGVVGVFINPLLSDLFKTRKWTVFGLMFFAIGSLVPFLVCPMKLTFIYIVILFIVFTFCGCALSICVTSLMREHYRASAAATCAGFLNMFTYVSAAIVQPVTGVILKRFGHNERGGYTEIGYRWGLWVISEAGLVLAQIVWFFIKDSEIRVDPKIQSQYDAVPEQDRSSIMDIDGSYVK